MGNRKRGYKPNSRTRQKRAAAIREWELENLEDDVEAEEPTPSRRATASNGDAGAAPRSMLSRIFTVEKRPATKAERDETPWSRRGLLTLSLVAAVIAIPLGAVAYFGESPQNGAARHSFALWVVATFGPAQAIPLFNVGLSCLIAMPIARALARESRNLRILEVLGYAAVVQILIYVLWSPVTTVNGWDYNGAAIAAGGVADLAALIGAAFLYPRVSAWLMRRSRRSK
jgi:hypothetical protein